jgi:hypothetical protein
VRKPLSLAALAGAVFMSTAAQADTILFQTFTDGLTAQEQVGGAFHAEGGKVGHTAANYENFDYSFYQVALDLTDFLDAQLMFDYAIVSENGYDGFNVVASEDGAFDWRTDLLTPISTGFYRPMQNRLSETGDVALSGVQSGTVLFDLSQFAGSKVNLRLQFQSDYSVLGRGVSLDNVIVTGTPDATPAGVPEPATWAMMILGFGAAGSMLRRRRFVAV